MPLINRTGSSYRNILLLLEGHFISKVGTALFDVALVLWLTEKTDLASVVGLVMMLSRAPEVLLSPLSGVVVDMVSRKRVLVASDLVAGIVVIGAGLTCFLSSGSIPLAFAALAAASVCIGICDSLFNPAVASFIPELVSETRLQTANAAYRFSTSAATFIGQAATGLLYALFGAPLLFILNGASYLVSAAFGASIFTGAPVAGMEEKNGHPVKAVTARLKEGLDYIRRYRALKGFLFLICVYHFFISPFTVVMPFYVTQVLHMAPAWYGYLTAIFGVGLLGGFLLSGILQVSGRDRARLVITCLSITAAAFLSIGLFPGLLLAACLVFVIGCAIAIIIVNLNTLIQFSTPKAMHGRIFGLYNTLSTASIPLGMGFFGLVLDLLKKAQPSLVGAPALIFLSCGIILCVISIFFGFSPSFRQVLSGAGSLPGRKERLATGD